MESRKEDKRIGSVPTFKVSRAANSSACFSIRSESLYNILPRSDPGTLKPHAVLYAYNIVRYIIRKQNQGILTFVATSTAISISFAFPPATEVMTLPVAVCLSYQHRIYHDGRRKYILPGLTTLHNKIPSSVSMGQPMMGSTHTR